MTDKHFNETEIFITAIETCSFPPQLYITQPIVGEWHIHDFMILLAGLALIITWITSFMTAIWHLRNYTVPYEQRQIVRIIWTPFVFGSLYFFSLWFYQLQFYAIAVAELYEIFAVVAIYLLFLAYVCPDHEDYESHFKIYDRAHTRKSKQEEQKQNPGGGSLLWFQLYSFGVLQILPTKIATGIATWVTTAEYCPLTQNWLDAGLYIRVVNGILIAILIFCVVRVYQGIKPTMKSQGQSGGWKLVIFKIMVILAQVQPVIFQILATEKDLNATTHVSFLDWVYGLPFFITVIEMCIFSFIFIFLFSASPYKAEGNLESGVSVSGRTKQPPMGFWAAAAHTVNYWDVVKRAWVVLTFAGYFSEKKMEKFGGGAGGERVELKGREGSAGVDSDGYEGNAYAGNAYAGNAYEMNGYQNGAYAGNPYGGNGYARTS